MVIPLGWYDSTYDEELGCQPCIFTSVTPVTIATSFYSGFGSLRLFVRLGIMLTSPGLQRRLNHHWSCEPVVYVCITLPH